MTEHTKPPGGRLECGCNLTGAFASITFCPTHDAAPDLLAALENLLSSIPDSTANRRWLNLTTAWDQARATIAKARNQ